MSSDSRVWLVTGASSGIGLAIIQEVLAIGERAAATTRNASSPSSVELTSLAAAHPSQLLVINYDPGDASYLASSLISQVTSHFGRLDVVVNNAGYARRRLVEGVSEEEARRQIEVNFWAPVKVSREAVRWFRENNTPAQGGRVLNVSSCGGFISNPTLAYYSASKFALEGFSEGLNKEMDAAWNIKVIVIQPGGVRTRWANGNMLDLPFPPAYADPAALPTRMRALIKNNVPSNDPRKVGKTLIVISKEKNPPLRLPLGADARYVIQGKIDAIQKELDEWKEMEVSVVADDANPHFFEKLTGTVM